MARPTWGVTAALVICGILAAWSGLGAATTVVTFLIDDSYPAAGGPGVRSDGAGGGTYADYRLDPTPPLNWCVDAAPYSQGLLFVRFNRKLDGDAGVQRCSQNPDGGGVNVGVPRSVRLTIDNDVVCDHLADPLAGLSVADSANFVWDQSLSSGPCTLAGNDNPRIRLETLYKARAKTTTLVFQTEMFGYPVSYVIEADAAVGITSLANVKVVAYNGTYHLVKFAPGAKPKAVGSAFHMPVKMTFATSVVL